MLDQSEPSIHNTSGSVSNVDVTDNSKSKLIENHTEVVELKEKLKSLTNTFEASERSLAKLRNIEGECFFYKFTKLFS